MTWLDSQLALLNILSNEIYCLSTVHVVIDFASESYVMAMLVQKVKTLSVTTEMG